ncbi:MAG: hypothetical protein M3487_05865 [Actinomycetota bacterium]|nr:hypothetical protein [Actinomycetota bacterium]
MPLVAALAGMAAVLALATADLAGNVIDAARARSAADAAALAGVEGGRHASSRLAAANGATLVTWSRSGRSVTVVVRVGAARATAAATGGPVEN